MKGTSLILTGIVAEGVISEKHTGVSSARDLFLNQKTVKIYCSCLLSTDVDLVYVFSFCPFCHFQSYGVTITVPGLREDAQALKLRFLPGMNISLLLIILHLVSFRPCNCF